MRGERGLSTSLSGGMGPGESARFCERAGVGRRAEKGFSRSVGSLAEAEGVGSMKQGEGHFLLQRLGQPTRLEGVQKFQFIIYQKERRVSSRERECL